MEAEILCGDCWEILPTFKAGSVQCCVTSPPYWGLRDYGTASWEGGAVGCDHKVDHTNNRQMFNGRGELQDKSCMSWTTRDMTAKSGGNCPKCGARRIDSQLGLEATPEEYVTKMVAVFREVRRVLRDDGTLWLNMGDSYASNPASGGQQSALMTGGEHKRTPQTNGYHRPSGLKPKDLCGIPWRLAFALQSDGWYLRSEIIWHKPNPMPESVTDRPTKAHEYIFLLAKQERYFYDADAIREPQISLPQNRNKGDDQSGVRRWHPTGAEQWNPNGRNKRTVWTVATQPYAEAHFATFPEDLIKPCIMAGSRLGDTILDPFAGSGTTGKVAIELGRQAILIELNPAYIELVRERTFVTPGFL